MLKKKQIYKFLDLFTINDDKTNDLIEKNNYSSISKLIKLKNPILNRFGVYFIFDKRVIQKKNNKFLKHLIYIGSAGGNIKKNKFIKPDSGESFFQRIHKHWLVTIGADKYSKPKPYKSISGSKKWRDYRDQKAKNVTYVGKFDLKKNHKNLLIGMISMKNSNLQDKIKIHYLEQFAIYKFKKEYRHIPICNTDDKIDKNLLDILNKL